MMDHNDKNNNIKSYFVNRVLQILRNMYNYIVIYFKIEVIVISWAQLCYHELILTISSLQIVLLLPHFLAFFGSKSPVA